MISISIIFFTLRQPIDFRNVFRVDLKQFKMKRTHSITAILMLTVGLFSCEKECPNPTPEPATPIVVTTISQNILYGSSEEGFTEENRVINDSVTWNAFKAQMNTVNEATLEFSEQNIDFSQWTVLASFDQVRPSGGFAINYSTVVENENNVIATVEKVGPGDGMVTTVITQPYIVVKIPKTSKTVIFN